MSLTDKLEMAITMARDMKEKQVLDAEARDGTDLWLTLQGWRGEDPVVALMPLDGGGGDSAIRAGQVLALGFGCDCIAVTTDAYRAHGETQEAVATNPLTGKRWEPGEMQDVAVNHDGLTKGWLSESLMVIVVNRAGDIAGENLDYTIIGDGPFGIEWGAQDHISIEEGGQLMGRIPEAMHRLMQTPTISQEMAAQGITGADFGLDYEESWAHQDAAMIKFMFAQSYQCGILLFGTGEKRKAILERSLSGFGLEILS